MTKSEEKYLFQKFAENYAEMPIGIADFDDRPDVTFKTSTEQIIGIEFTECIYDKDLMKESEFQIKFNKKVIAQLQEKMTFKFHLDINLDTKKPLRQNEVNSTIKEIIKVCTLEFGDLKPYKLKYVEQLDIDWEEAPLDIQKQFRESGFRKLPKGISRIQMSRYDILENSRHPESKGGLVPDFTDADLNNILEKKNKALLQYKPCDIHWLVISEGADFYSYMNNVRIENEIKTAFDKVFMYRRWSSEVIVIK